MDKVTIGILLVIALIVVLTFMSAFAPGCALFSNPPSQPSVPPTPIQRSIEGLSSLSWWCMIGVGLSVFGFLNGCKWAVPAAVACLTALSLNLAVLKYSTVVSIIGLVGAAGVSIYSLFIKGRGIWLEKTTKKKII